MKNKPLWRRAINAAQDFVTDPQTRHMAEVGGKLLGVAAQIGQAKLTGPVGVFGAGVGLLNIISNETKKNAWRQIDEFAKKRHYQEIEAEGAIRGLYEQGAFANGEIVFRVLDEYKLVSIPIKEDQDAVVILNKEDKLHEWWPAFLAPKLVSEDVNQALWNMLGNTVKLTTSKSQMSWHTHLTAKPVTGYDDDPYEGAISPETFAQNYLRMREKGVTCANLLLGPPGGGKTTFCFQMNKILKGRMMILTVDILSGSIPQDEILELIRTFKPTILLLDDVDSVQADAAKHLLSLLDFVRRENPDAYVISTANVVGNIVESLRRPGRLGARVMFTAPDVELRKKLLRIYSEKFNVGRDLTELAAEMDHPKFTHDYVKDVCRQAIILDDEGLKKHIAEVKTYLG